MSPAQSQTSNLPVTAVVVTALAAGGVFLMQEPLSSHRHKEPAQTVAIQSQEENVDARLWQDPMYAINNDWTNLVSYVVQQGKLPPSAVLPHTIKTLSEGWHEHGASLDNQRRLQLVVMMPSEPYADDAEHRRRQRYALVTALAASGYSPEHADRIGYFIAPGMRTEAHHIEEESSPCTATDTNQTLCPIQDRPLVVGYESFEPAGGAVGNWDEVQVLWLARKELGNSLLPKVRALTRYLQDRSRADYTTVLLGPDDSGGLRDMVMRPTGGEEFSETEYRRQLGDYPKDARKILLSQWTRSVAPGQGPAASDKAVRNPCESPPNDEPTEPSDSFHVLSPRSTVPLPILFPDCGFENLTPRQADQRITRFMGVSSFYTMLARDDAVIRNIISELDARGLDDCRSARGIAVVSEVDSSYGRALPKVVEQAIDEIMGCRIHVHSFGYLRGVDGELPPNVRPQQPSGLADHSEAANAKEQQFNLMMSTASPERAVGAAQTDYIRRLAGRIAQRHDAISVHNHEGFRAIGILGADVYDKQLLIHALRDKLPAVTFFTTDLDARLNAPDEYEWTRNLIIGSAYGLTPPESELDVAPLRDSYQTAFFLATKLALDIRNLIGSRAMLTEQATAPPPRLFEIGRSGAIDITVCDAACLQRTKSFGTVGWLRHAGGVGDVIARTLILISPLLALTFSSLLLNSRMSKTQCRHRVEAQKLVATVAAAATLIMAIILWSWDGMELEPWLLTDGVSSVPTLMLHISALVYSISFWIIVRGRIRQHHVDCGERFGLTDESDESALNAWKPARTSFRQDVSLSQWARDISDCDEEGSDQSSSEIWLRYRHLSRLPARVFRVLPLTILWTAVVWLLLSKDANPLLARNLQDWLDLVRIITVFAVLGVIFTCVDTLALGQLLIRAFISQKSSGWTNRKMDRGQLDEEVARMWCKMQLIVVHTKLLSPLLILPFIVLFMLILARMTIFDGWVWTPSLVATYLGFSVFLLIRAWLFQREAANARDRIVEQLECWRIRWATDDISFSRTNYVIEQIRGVDQGAFVPWTRHPIVQSVLLPAAGLVILSMLGLLT